MLPALYDDQRRAIARLATMLTAGSLAVLPLTAQSSFVAGAASAQETIRNGELATPARLTFPAYAIDRDPFVPDANVRAFESADADARMAAQPGSTPVVRAVIVGAQARALVEIDGTVRVLSVGDALGASRIAAIDASGLMLADGSHLALDGTRR
ncbi:MAG TPA: hypothetical protein VMD47_08070 [Candidatus Acidoferrales bacterium]|nr:hypothetical protein [Candidatus Acidoferrales bacterium]